MYHFFLYITFQVISTELCSYGLIEQHRICLHTKTVANIDFRPPMPAHRRFYQWFRWTLSVIAMDTAKDARVLILEDALRRLNEIVSNRKLKMHISYGKLGDLLAIAGGLLYEVKYSYQDSQILADFEATQKLVSAIAEFEDLYRAALSSGHKPSTVKEKMVLAEVEYSLRIVRGFPARLREFDDEPGLAVDILSVEISQISSVEGSDKLSECRCTDGTRIWNIITNLPDVKTGVKLACAVLPPVEMMNHVSEAMFLGSTPLPDDLPLGTLTNPPEISLAQARAQVLQITKRMA